jgi:hypothetical protein
VSFFFYTLLTKRAARSWSQFHLHNWPPSEQSWQPEFQGIIESEDYALVQSLHSGANYTQFEIPAPLSIVENTVFPIQAVAGIEATVPQPHDPYYTLDNPFGLDEFECDIDWTSLVLNHSHDELSVPPAPETDEIVNDLFEGNHSNDVKSFRYVRRLVFD